MEDEGSLVCLICGTDSNKKQKHDRYNYLPPMKKKGKFSKNEESDTDSDDSLKNSKSKKSSKTKTQRAPVRVSAGSRQTRNQNPKSYALSLCKVMNLPATPDEPFMQIFSRAHYCSECMPRVKEAHNSQLELESIKDRIRETKVDIELDLTKHLRTIPIHVKVMRNPAYSRYEEDIKLILEFTGQDKKTKKSKEATTEENPPTRERRQAAINSTLKIMKSKAKRKLDDSSEEDDEEEEEEEKEDVKVKKPKKKEPSEVVDTEFVPEDSTSSKAEKEEPDSSAVELKDEQEDEPESSSSNADNGSSDVVKEEEKPVEIVKVKKDPSLKCPHCPIPRYFNIAANLEEHISKAHAYVCDVCEKTFKFESDMKKHKGKVHVQNSEDKTAYICGFCDQEFQLKKYLEDHLDQHQEAKPLNCHQCGRGFTRKESLQKAFQINKGENVEPCKNCGKNLNLKDYLEHNKRLKQS